MFLVVKLDCSTSYENCGKHRTLKWWLITFQCSWIKAEPLNIILKQFLSSPTFACCLWVEVLFMFFFLSGMRLSPLGMSASNCSIVPAPDDIWVWNIWWNENWQGKLKYSEKTCPSATLSTTNPTWPDLGLNLGCCSGKLATNCLSYGLAFLFILVLNWFLPGSFSMLI
jgi:hypothetical protein